MNTKYMRTAMTALLLLAGSMGITTARGAARDTAAAEVFVYKQVTGTAVRYTYVVKNNGTAPITSLEVGFDYYNGAAELSGDEAIELVAPPGWVARKVSLEESEFYSLVWEVESPDASIKPGQLKVGFVANTGVDRNGYSNSHWTVVLDGSISAASSRIEQIEGPLPSVDTLPPLLRVSVSPSQIWPPDHKLHAISVSITVSDETDPAPTVKLVSITCNECAAGDISGAEIGSDDRGFFLRANRAGKDKSGRVYSITYQAIDSSGNVANSTASVQIPHDQR